VATSSEVVGGQIAILGGFKAGLPRRLQRCQAAASTGCLRLHSVMMCGAVWLLPWLACFFGRRPVARRGFLSGLSRSICAALGRSATGLLAHAFWALWLRPTMPLAELCFKSSATTSQH
jgi:hypothetical protein